MALNRQVETLLLSAEWMIEPVWGLQQLHSYLAQLELLEKGAKYSELGFSEIRAAAKPTLLELAGTASNGSSESDIRKVTHLKLSGVMKMEDGSYTYGAKTLASFLRYADSLPEVVGHIIEINSGGGEALAGALMHETVKALKKPVYALAHLAASAAYLTAAAADKLYMQSQFSSIGSIGVMASIDKELLKLYRDNIMDIYAEASPEKNIEWRQLVNEDKYDLYQKRLDELAVVFHDKVKANRPGIDLATLKGKVYIGDTAMAMKLADGYSNIDELSNKLLGGPSAQAIEADSVDSDDEDEDFNSKIDDMTLQQRMANQFLRVLGINVPGTDAGMNEAVTLLEGMTSLQNSVDSAVEAAIAPLNERIADLTTRLDGALNKTGADNTLSERLAKLETELSAIKAENLELSKRVLDGDNAEQSGDSGSTNNIYFTQAQQQFGATRERVQG